MGAPTTTPTQNSGTLATSGTPVATPAPAVAAPTAPQLQPVPGSKTVKLHGIEFTVQGYDPKSKRYILTCPDTEDNRKPFPSNIPGVRQIRNQHETVANSVQHNRNLNTPDGKGLLTVTVPLGKNATEPSLQDLQAQVKKGVGKMHIVDRTATEQAQAKTEKKSLWDRFCDHMSENWGWYLLGIVITGVVGYYGFRKGGWFRSKKSKTPSTPSTPNNPGTQIPDHEDEWGNANNNTNTGNVTGIPENSNGSISTPMNPSTNTGGTTVVQGGNQTLVNAGQSFVAGTTTPVSGPSDRTGRD